MQATAEILRLKRCAQCNYSLEGLGAEGRCPECGWAFTRQHIVLYGWAYQMDGSSDVRQPNEYSGYVVAGLLILGGATTRVVAADRDVQVFALQFLIAGVLMTLLLMFNAWRDKRAQGENAGPWQLHIGPEGWGIRFGPGQLKLNPWERNVVVEARRMPKGRCLLSVVRKKEMVAWTLTRKDITVASAAITLRSDLKDLALVVERAAGWLGTTVDWRLDNRKDWVVRAQAPASTI